MRDASMVVAMVLSAVFGGISAASLAQSPHTHRHTFDNAEQWAHVFDDPKRDASRATKISIDLHQRGGEAGALRFLGA